MKYEIKEFLRTIVVPCAGRSSRFSADGGKWRSRVAGESLLEWVVSPWRGECGEWIFVSAPGDDYMREFVAREGASARVAVQPEPAGITDAILCADPPAEKPFTVLLGDCVARGKFAAGELFNSGVGVAKNCSPRDTAANYGVVERGGAIVRAVEKPADATGMLCGMGVYFISPELFIFMKETAALRGRDVHITSVLRLWIDSGQSLSAIFFDGDYVNVNTPEDLEKAESVVRNMGLDL